MTESIHPAQFIRLDLFPATIEKDGQLFGEELRVIITDDTFYVFKETGTGPGIYLKKNLVEFLGSNLTGYTVIVDDETYAIKRSPTCGCGSSLRGFFPFPGVPFIGQVK